jgi:hypothetical protein
MQTHWTKTTNEPIPDIEAIVFPYEPYCAVDRAVMEDKYMRVKFKSHPHLRRLGINGYGSVYQ